MKAERYNELATKGGLLTVKEKQAWHYCHSFNGKLIHVTDWQFEKCTCKDGEKLRGTHGTRSK